MFSKIGNPPPPAPARKDSVPVLDPSAVRGAEREEGRPKKEGQGSKKSVPEETAAPEDVMFFSLQALRALLLQERVQANDPVFGNLDLLEKSGIASVPIRENQAIAEAIAEAASHAGKPA